MTTKTEARRIADHLIGSVHVVAAGRGSKTWGYSYACGPRNYTTAQHHDTGNGYSSGEYRHARRARKEHVEQLAEDIIAGEAPEWATMDFKW